MRCILVLRYVLVMICALVWMCSMTLQFTMFITLRSRLRIAPNNVSRSVPLGSRRLSTLGSKQISELGLSPSLDTAIVRIQQTREENNKIDVSQKRLSAHGKTSSDRVESDEAKQRTVHFSGRLDELFCTAEPSEQQKPINALRQIR